MKRKISLNNTVLIQLVMVGVISVLSIGYLWVSSERFRFEKEVEIQRSEYIKAQKETLKREVDRALAFINYMRSQTEKRIQNSVKGRVYEAHSIAENIYEQSKKDKSISEIKTMIKNALRPVRFKNGRGYYFAFDLEGVEILLPVKPDMEGKNMLRVTGGQGEFVVPEMLAVINENEEGFYRYTWPKPGREGYFPKMAFVKLLKPLGWVIGTGEYLDDVETDIQKESIEWISNITFGKDGYVFAGQWDGISLSGPATGRNMYSVEDINGVKIVQGLIEAAKSGGGFVHYVLPIFEGKKQASKISYAAGISDWQWYIGSGIYVDEIEDVIDLKRSALNETIKKNSQNIFFIIISLLVFILVFVKILSNRIRNNLTLFAQFFNRASIETVEIKRDKLNFIEFDQLAISANHMVEKQKKTERALQTSHQRFLTVLDGIDATIYVADMETYEILFMNKHMREIFGGDLTGKLCWDAFRNDSGPCPHCSNEKLVDQEGNPSEVHVWQGENFITNKWYINYDRAIEWTDGKLVKLQIATDITEFKKMEAELRQAHKMESIGTIAGGIAHDFNNILSIIIGNVELALDGMPDWNPAYKNINEIKAASFRARDVVRQLLSFSRKSDQDWKPLDIVPVLKEALNLVRSSIPSNIEIHKNIPVISSNILADATQIHQVVINLCTNASHSIIDSEGIIEVYLNEICLQKSEGGKFEGVFPGNYIELVVRDNGSGIDPVLIDKIFDPYFTTKGVGEGTGMGLSVVHGIVKNHNGTIFVDSKVGRGTAFYLFFPTTDKKIEQTSESTNNTSPIGNEKILFVDDENAITEMTEKVFEKLGYFVETYTSPKDALEQFSEKPEQFDLIITDMTMPVMNGIEFSEKVKKVRPDIPIIICTGNSSLMDSKKIVELDIAAIEIKPVSMSKIAKTIRTVLDT